MTAEAAPAPATALEGCAGSVEIFGVLDDESQKVNVTDNNIKVTSNDGTPGSCGNHGWGGVNLTGYIYKQNYNKDEYDITIPIENSGYLSRPLATFNVYNNGIRLDSQNISQVSKYFTYYSHFEIGRRVGTEEFPGRTANIVNINLRNDNTGNQWYEIYFSRNDDDKAGNDGIVDYGDTKWLNIGAEHRTLCVTDGSISVRSFAFNKYDVGWGNNIKDELTVKIFVLSENETNNPVITNSICYGRLADGNFGEIVVETVTE